MILLVFFVFLFQLIRGLYRRFYPLPNIDPKGKYVLISGCDSGFGYQLAIELDRQGFNVFAGILNSNNDNSLRTQLSHRAIIFPLDVTKQESIDAAYDLVKDKTQTLHALVNNAGISTSGYIDWITMESMRKIMEVNFFGHVAMTKKFLPILITKRYSRVVNICSVAGFVSAQMKSAYSASKYALESFSDCLRREMYPWGLYVSIIEPGPMRTPIIQGHNEYMKEFWRNLSTDVQQRWGEEFLQIQSKKISDNFLYRHAEDPIKVVNALQNAVCCSKPEIRYRPGWQSKYFFLPLSMLPDWLADWILISSANSTIQPTGLHKQHVD